jgi:hypothetical protein
VGPTYADAVASYRDRMEPWRNEGSIVGIVIDAPACIVYGRFMKSFATAVEPATTESNWPDAISCASCSLSKRRPDITRPVVRDIGNVIVPAVPILTAEPVGAP